MVCYSLYFLIDLVFVFWAVTKTTDKPILKQNCLKLSDNITLVPASEIIPKLRDNWRDNRDIVEQWAHRFTCLDSYSVSCSTIYTDLPPKMLSFCLGMTESNGPCKNRIPNTQIDISPDIAILIDGNKFYNQWFDSKVWKVYYDVYP